MKVLKKAIKKLKGVAVEAQIRALKDEMPMYELTEKFKLSGVTIANVLNFPNYKINKDKDTK